MRGIGLTREKVIEQAGKLANEKGLNAVTITALAEYLGIKKPSLYNHIKDQNDIWYGIMLTGWRIISDELCSGIKESDPKSALKALARGIYEFAINNPGIFEAILWCNCYATEELVNTTKGLYVFFFEQTDKLSINKENANHLLRTFRSLVEGFSLLVIHSSFGNPIPINESFEISMEVFVNGIEQYRE